MKNGLYKVEFKTQLGAGAGVAVLQDGRILGGDSSISYIGDYHLEGDRFKATVKTSRHSPGLINVLGKDDATIVIAGRVTGDSAALIGTTPAAPGVEFEAFIEFISA